ncbi:hypothetical protein Y032_0175g496 [Ancylostoma ceylanicum]|uniref:Uncharacterized protein n=1 Tax=Ancylostoma ceylanicum TaxID=53326 RepID=A0A016SUR1_9BILA|nr:hypothetical protein Y032_0175g496 [Ancylostoma ceylanicum]
MDSSSSESDASSAPLVDGDFQDVFGYPATLRTFCPGRLILTGEHIDFHGYSVISMTTSDGTAILAGRNGKSLIRIVSKDPDKKEVTISLPSRWAGTKTPEWHDFVLCGWKAVMDYIGDVQIGFDMLIHERIPKSCGAGSTTSLVVASALTTWAISTNKEFDDLTREEFAELCYIARCYLGAQGTGVDEATLSRPVFFYPDAAMYVSRPENVSESRCWRSFSWITSNLYKCYVDDAFLTIDGLPIVPPYVEDASARRVNQAVKNSRLLVRLIFVPPPTIKDLLTSARIYENKCLEANCLYRGVNLRTSRHSLYDQLRWVWLEVHRRDDEASSQETKRAPKSFSKPCPLS